MAVQEQHPQPSLEESCGPSVGSWETHRASRTWPLRLLGLLGLLGVEPDQAGGGAGALAGKADAVAAVRSMHNVLGGTIDPHAAYLLLRGMKTLDVRVQRQNSVRYLLPQPAWNCRKACTAGTAWLHPQHSGVLGPHAATCNRLMPTAEGCWIFRSIFMKRVDRGWPIYSCWPRSPHSISLQAHCLSL